MKRSLSTTLLLLILKSIFLQAAADETRLAQAYFEAGDYARAKIEYEGLIDEGQEQWKNEILRYDAASSLLAGGLPEEALLLLEELAEEEIRLPFLKKNVFFNLALARLEQLNVLLSKLNDNANPAYEDYWQVHVFLVRTMEEMQKAELAWCQLESAEGASKCPSSEPLFELNLEFKRLLNVFLKESLGFRLSYLNEISHLIFKKNRVEDILQMLLNTYTIALMQEPLQEAYLVQILGMQKDYSDILKASVDASVFSDFSRSLNFLKLSVQFQSHSQRIQTRFYAEIARFYMKEVVEQLHSNTHNEPAHLLEGAIAKEEFILFLDHLKGQVPNPNHDFDAASELFPALQKIALNDAGRFLKTVFNKQKEAFGQKNPSKNRCQCTPWNEAIPLFSEGYASAQLAYRRLTEGTAGAIGPLQKTAVRRWNEALIRMKNPSSEERQSFHEKETQQEREAPKESGRNGRLDAIQRLVQEMEEDDKSRPEIQRTSTGIGRQERPW